MMESTKGLQVNESFAVAPQMIESLKDPQIVELPRDPQIVELPFQVL